MGAKYEAEKELLEAAAKAKGISVEQLVLEAKGNVTTEINNDQTVVVLSEEPVPVIETITEAPDPQKDVFVPTVEDFAPPPPVVETKTEQKEQIESLAPICNNCGWDQRKPVMEQPDKQDKLTFLFSVLGQKVFTKEYSTMGSKLKMSFRSLTVKELDALYSAAYAEQKAGHIENAQEYYEYLNRQRLFLQLQIVNSSITALHTVLPDGLSKEANNFCSNSWEEFLTKENAYDPEDSLIPQIEKYILKYVLNTEHLQRIVSHYCAKFNQLVARMETCIEDENFWNGIEMQL